MVGVIIERYGLAIDADIDEQTETKGTFVQV